MYARHGAGMDRVPLDRGGATAGRSNRFSRFPFLDGDSGGAPRRIWPNVLLNLLPPDWSRAFKLENPRARKISPSFQFGWRIAFERATRLVARASAPRDTDVDRHSTNTY